MLALFTDFGLEGPYVGLLKLALMRHAPEVPVLDLFHNAPAFDAQASAYLLATYAQAFPEGTVLVAVVDPGVGGKRAALILLADGRFYIGPDNGLFDRVAARARQIKTWHITWQPPRLSASFHGRDLFAPVAAMLAAGTAVPQQLGKPIAFTFRDWPDDLARVVYIDHYGNAMTGIRASSLTAEAKILIKGHTLSPARTFSDVPAGCGFWYENANGLVELAINQDSAAAQWGLCLGDPIQVMGKGLTVIREA